MICTAELQTNRQKGGRIASEHEQGRQTWGRGYPGGFAQAFRDRGGVPANSRGQGRGHTPPPRSCGTPGELQPGEKGGVFALQRRKRRGLWSRRGGGSKVGDRP